MATFPLSKVACHCINTDMAATSRLIRAWSRQMSLHKFTQTEYFLYADIDMTLPLDLHWYGHCRLRTTWSLSLDYHGHGHCPQISTDMARLFILTQKWAMQTCPLPPDLQEQGHCFRYHGCGHVENTSTVDYQKLGL